MSGLNDAITFFFFNELNPLKSELNSFKMKENIILIKSINFSVEIKKYCEVLYFKKETAIANQLLRCGMAIGANVSEAQNAES